MCGRERRKEEEGGRGDKGGASGKQLVNLGKEYMGVSCTIIETSLQVWTYIKIKNKKANWIKCSQKLHFY